MRAVLLAWFVAALAFAAYVQAEQRADRDLVFVTEQHCKGNKLECARAVYFNGNWDGAMLCRGKVCILFEEAFK